MSAENLLHLEGMYALAIQFGDYRKACRFAVRAMRREDVDRAKWKLRLGGSWKRRVNDPVCRSW